MGAAESIFYDDEPSTSSSFDQQQQQQHPVPHNVRHPPTMRRPRRRSRPGAVGGGAGSPDATVPARLLLHGHVLGLPGSGKRTLLERLKGKDPFVVEDPPIVGGGDPSVMMMTMNSESQQQQQSDDKPSAVVPYQAPAGSATWDRLQIKVQVSPTIPPVLESSSRIDFAVILVNPKHDPGQVQAYLKQTISDFLKSYDEYNHSNNNSSDSRQEQQPASSPQQDGVQRSLCLCFLVNFRDLQHSKKQRSGIQESEVKQCVIGILQQNAERLPSNDQLLLQFGTTSLYNCFGLSTLHHFIYNTYLRMKHNELQQQLMEVHDEMSRSQETSGRMKYKDFLKIVGEEVEEKRKKSNKKQHNRPPKTKQDPNLQSLHENPPYGNGSGSNSGDIPHRQQQQHDATAERRDIVSKTHAPPAAQKAQRQSLEAFLASDDEGEKTMAKSKQRRHASSESDDEDDDFFYDEAGERCTVHNGNTAKSISSQVKVSGTSKPAPTTGQALRRDLSSQESQIDEQVTAPSEQDSQRPTSGDVQLLPPSTTIVGSSKVENFQAAPAGSRRKTEEQSDSDGESSSSERQQPTEGSDEATQQKSGAIKVEDPDKVAVSEVPATSGVAVDTIRAGETLERASENSPARQVAFDTQISLDTQDQEPETTKEERGESDRENKKSGTSDQIAPEDPQPKSALLEKGKGKEDTDEAATTREDQEDDQHVMEQPAGESMQEEASDQLHSANVTEHSSDGSGLDREKHESAVASDVGTMPDNQDAPACVGASRKSIPVAPQQTMFDSDDEDEFFVEDSAIRAPKGDSDEEDDDDEFFVGEDPEEPLAGSATMEEQACPQKDATEKKSEVVDEEDAESSDGGMEVKADETSILPDQQAEHSRTPTVQPPESEPPATSSVSFSSAAQAAIAAAQEEAELMLQQSMESQASAATSPKPDKSMKKDKKKKKEASKERKKAKKEKKAKRKEQAEISED